MTNLHFKYYYVTNMASNKLKMFINSYINKDCTWVEKMHSAFVCFTFKSDGTTENNVCFTCTVMVLSEH